MNQREKPNTSYMGCHIIVGHFMVVIILG